MSDRKMVQPTMTMIRVYTRERGRGFLSRPLIFSMVSTTKYMSPQRMNVQLAPCQMPVSSHTTNKLKMCRARELTRLPPKGMYT